MRSLPASLKHWPPPLRCRARPQQATNRQKLLKMRGIRRSPPLALWLAALMASSSKCGSMRLTQFGTIESSFGSGCHPFICKAQRGILLRSMQVTMDSMLVVVRSIKLLARLWRLAARLAARSPRIGLSCSTRHCWQEQLHVLAVFTAYVLEIFFGDLRRQELFPKANVHIASVMPSVGLHSGRIGRICIVKIVGITMKRKLSV